MKRDSLKKSLLFLALLLLPGMIYWGCSQDANPLPSKTHTEDWGNPQSENFHGAKVIAVGEGSCKSCHGADYEGGESGVSCYSCHDTFPHQQHWMVISGDDFHGKYLSENDWPLEECQKCHGQDYGGGNTGVSCYDCHTVFPHPEEWLTVSSEKFHGNYIRKNGWTLKACQGCHGEDYNGGETSVACTSCHTDEGGPEACNVCHGNSDHSYPPEDLNKNTETTALGVGAHEEHMNLYECSICHIVPESFDAPGHIDAPPAEVNEQWQWDRNAGTCAASCHGDSKIWNNF